jgi:heme/copper-type cytochrome/quinol oxidase subunit 4
MAEETTTYDKLMQKKNEKYMIGVTVAIILFVMTIGEFMLAEVGANTETWITVLLLIAILKAFLVVREYMHIGRVFRAEEEEH